MSKGFKIILYFLLFVFLLITVGNFTTTIIPTLLLTIIVIICTELIIKTKNKKMKDIKTKKCKYCQQEIDRNASVCPNCKRGLTFNTNSSVLIILLFLVGLIALGIVSNNAPLFVRKTVCGLGIRDDFPYCYYIDWPQ